jgi:hypothetical protein
LEFLAFICTFLFTPAMCALSAIEVWKGAGVYYWTYSAPLTSNDLVKAAIPLAIAGLGLVELLMCFIALCYTCCCEYARPAGFATYGVAAPAPQVVVRSGTYDRPVYQPACGPRAQIFPPAFNRGPPQFSGASYGGGFAAPQPPRSSCAPGPTTAQSTSPPAALELRSSPPPSTVAHCSFRGPVMAGGSPPLSPRRVPTTISQISVSQRSRRRPTGGEWAPIRRTPSISAKQGERYGL